MNYKGLPLFIFLYMSVWLGLLLRYYNYNPIFERIKVVWM